MDQSEQQFRELLAQVIAYVKTTLRDHKPVPAFGLQLLTDGQVQLTLGANQAGEPSVDMLIDHLRGKASEGALVACAIIQPMEDQRLSVFLENKENYCTDLVIPFRSGAPPEPDVENMSVDDGVVRIFPAM